MNFNNKNIWIITDGSQGMISQVRGLAQEFSKKIYSIKTELYFPWSLIQPGFLPIFKWIFKNKINFSNKPEIIITCGRKSVYLSLYLKKKLSNKVITIHIQNPKFNISKFDYIIAPKHDNLSGKNVIESIGAIHKFGNTETLDKDYFNISFSKKNLVTILIGGKNRHYDFNEKIILDLTKKIIKLKNDNSKINIIVITSRRTGSKINALLQSYLNKIAYVWDGKNNNPYSFSLINSKHFIVTSDSTSMISECASTGKPIYIFHLPFKRKSRRMEEFHEEFANRKITKKFIDNTVLEDWKYETFNEAKRISGILKERIIKGL